jgi:hypothetical protein
LTLQWFLAGSCLLLTAAVLLYVRRLSKKLERLSQSYWELRYEHGQLSARLARLEPQDEVVGDRQQSAARTAFVPLSSLKK